MGGISDVDRGLCAAPTGIDTWDSHVEMVERMRRVVDIKDRIVQDEFRWDLKERVVASPREMLAGRRRFDTDEERLLYLRYTIEQELGSRATRDRIADAMADYEMDRIKAMAADAVPQPLLASPYNPGTAAAIALQERGLEWAETAAASDRSEYEAFLYEVGRLDDADRQELRKLYLNAGGAAPADLYQQYIGEPFREMVNEAKQAVPGLVSLLLDFTPIIGQLKAVIEGIYGTDLITGRKLEAWEKGLGILLAIIPEARGIFKAGRTGVRTLVAVARESRLPAEEVYRVTKVASKLTEEEVSAARKIVNGRPTNPREAEKVAGSIEDMLGSKPRGARSTSYRVAAGVNKDGRGLSKSVASSPIKAGAEAPGKVINATTTAPAIATRLWRSGISQDAVAALERAGVKITDDAATVLINTKAGVFINMFHGCAGFEEVVKDVIKPGTKKKGGLFVIEFVTDRANSIDPATVKFELPGGITKTPTREFVARETDLVITIGDKTTNYEFKAYSKAAVAASLQDPKKIAQLVKDVAIFGRRNIRWVYDSREVSKAFVYKKFADAIKSDALLAKEFGEGAKLEQALDQLIIMYPPVPKAPALPYSAPVKAAGAATSPR
jgi:Pre-toxin TG